MPLWQSYVFTVVQNFHTDRVYHEAMSTDEWKAHRKGPPDTYIKDWNKNLVVKLVPNSFDITVTYTDDHKDGQVVAPIAVRSVINAYKDLYGDQQRSSFRKRKTGSSRKDEILDQKIAELRNPDHPAYSHRRRRSAKGFRDQVYRARRVGKRTAPSAEGRIDCKSGRSETGQRTTGNDALHDRGFRARRSRHAGNVSHPLGASELEYQELAKRLGPKHPATLAAKDRLKTRRRLAMERIPRELECQVLHQAQDRRDRRPIGQQGPQRRRSRRRARRNASNWPSMKLELDDLSTRTHKVKLFSEPKKRASKRIGVKSR